MTEVEHPGEAWRRVLADTGLTQLEVAQSMGISAKHLNLIVNGKQTPSADLTVRFAEATKADVTELWERSSDYMFDQTRKLLAAQRTFTAQQTRLGKTGILEVQLKVTIPADVTEPEVEELLTSVLVSISDQTAERFGRPVSDGYSTEGS